jgi:hypothetical protein
LSNRLDRYKQQILDFKAEGESVRSIAAKLTEASGERIAPSTVQHFLKQSNGNGESVQNDSALILAKMDEIKAQLDRIEYLKLEDWGCGARVLRDTSTGRGLAFRGEIHPAPWWERLFNRARDYFKE